MNVNTLQLIAKTQNPLALDNTGLTGFIYHFYCKTQELYHFEGHEDRELVCFIKEEGGHFICVLVALEFIRDNESNSFLLRNYGKKSTNAVKQQ
jgi:hypothetical protein